MEQLVTKKRIAENIKALISYYGLNIKDIEEQAGVSVGYISKIIKENSDSSSNLISLLLTASDRFRISIDSLLSLDFKRIASKEKMRFFSFLETVLDLSNRGQLNWTRNKEKLDEDSVASFMCSYDENISFYIAELDVMEDEEPGFAFYIKNKEASPSLVAKYNNYGPAIYDMLSKIFEIASASTEQVIISESSDLAIRKFMSDNKLYIDFSNEQQKYRPLYDYLKDSTRPDIKLTFDEVEHILGFKLPLSAYKYHSFWENSTNGQHHHCKSWISAGYKTVNINLNTINHIVHFKKTE